MRHNFVNDIGDYAKYALLRALCAGAEEPIRLGVIWYLTEHAEHNGDGRKRAHLSQDGWERLDPGLLAAMRQIERGRQCAGSLSIRLIEDSGILPAGTAYFAEAMPNDRMPARRASERAAWFARAHCAVDGCDLVFLDPDNGLQVPSVPLTSSLAGKYATTAEIATLIQGGAGVVLYQHGNRTSWPQQRQQVCAQITAGLGQLVTIRSVRFGAFGARAFFCITASQRQSNAVARGLDLLRDRVEGWDKSVHLLFE